MFKKRQLTRKMDKIFEEEFIEEEILIANTHKKRCSFTKDIRVMLI